MEKINQFESIRVNVCDGVGHLMLNRPQRLNALSKNMLLEICNAMTQFEAEQQVRAIVLSGAGNGFSSGFDLKDQMERQPRGTRVWREILDLDFNTTMRFWRSPKPTIAAVHGPCVAGAFEMALACDITIASEDAFFGEPELRFGAGIVTMLLPWMASPKHAKRIILSGQDRVGARLAMEMGLVSEVTAPGEHLNCALRVARNIARMDTDLVQQTKKAIQRTYEIQGLEASLAAALDIDHAIESHGSPDKAKFMDIARSDGLKSALAWRVQRFEEE
ncbi:enoyl-CoA hydratase/isomerase family protein [Burkholderia cenocepacia]|uniref:Enoyl-CoA hydratase/isomerase family protein n=1 Tax=Burkholderia cenocepacia TaxID=95486 RepID=A0ABD4UKT9_9BURK|nr:enoyl-CoA hydratase/isomerase family protein [Burkholderia cenocepacia]MCW3698910.1 enoyl-CoA hydratase/isomerase family protein [Burkholderia cenocepacia]MCW3706528.1 enoyl-CoA hydratase/isomerase family protein [Burkholderia cenocepacia]MCW3714981.1 enoyl-CoA hydratase/isomerase family protein [Burkholderia cenocepacia]MCW3722703.1 enoyl-CoA hydratase/isomerase family protein [Burkholderia cenocepacia]MCW3729757.1 enoyl-CoA hydratase/isomerase family protein [Burkholderia cenocepacia]